MYRNYCYPQALVRMKQHSHQVIQKVLQVQAIHSIMHFLTVVLCSMLLLSSCVWLFTLVEGEGEEGVEEWKRGEEEEGVEEWRLREGEEGVEEEEEQKLE